MRGGEDYAGGGKWRTIRHHDNGFAFSLKYIVKLQFKFAMPAMILWYRPEGFWSLPLGSQGLGLAATGAGRVRLGFLDAAPVPA